LDTSLFLTKITSFFHRACCNNFFSLRQTDRYFITTARPLAKTSSWRENCTKFGHFILSKIIKIVTTSCEILWRKFIKFDFGWGSPGLIAGIQRPPSKGRKGEEQTMGGEKGDGK